MNGHRNEIPSLSGNYKKPIMTSRSTNRYLHKVLFLVANACQILPIERAGRWPESLNIFPKKALLRNLLPVLHLSGSHTTICLSEKCPFCPEFSAVCPSFLLISLPRTMKLLLLYSMPVHNFPMTVQRFKSFITLSVRMPRTNIMTVSG